MSPDQVSESLAGLPFVQAPRVIRTSVVDYVDSPSLVILLQGDHGTVSFRNISLKELPK